LFSFRSPGARTRRRSPVRPTIAALLVTIAGAALASPAQANLAAVGPVDPATQVPAWFQDASGLKLGLCLTAPFCLSTAADFAAPDGEAFYFNAGADLTINGAGKAKLVLAQEAVSAPSGPAAFMRVRVVLTGAVPNATYTVTHPFGTVTITTDGTGGGRSTTDTGCSLAPCPTFGGALGGQIGPFLTWTPDPGLPPNHIGDGLTPHTVTGGTNGNSFVVAGPGGSSTNLFTVAGELAGPPVPVINAPASLDFGPAPVGVPVQKSIAVRSFGVPDAGGASFLSVGTVPASITGPGAGAYTLVANSCIGVFASGQSCTMTLQMKAPAAGALPAVLSIPSNATGGNGTVELSGTGLAAGVAGISSRSTFQITKLRTTHRMSRARVLARGLRLSMRLPQGTEILKVSVLRVRSNGRANRKPVYLAFRLVGRVGPGGLYRLRLDSRALRRRMKAGLYQLNVTPGVSRRQLGRTSTTRIRITRN
jgi:hypothetical protein